MSASIEEKKDYGRLQLVGYGLILLFFLYSVIHVTFISRPEILSRDVQTLTVAHWNCTNDVRMAYQEVFDAFEALKAQQGVKVRILQTAIPGDGYNQWQTTQLIGGNPADVMAVHWMMPQSYIEKYFTPLTIHAGLENPYNRQSPLEGVPWRDSLFDAMGHPHNMNDVYQVSCHFHLFRFFVNLDMLERATGRREMPRDLPEMLKTCEQIQQYGQERDAMIVPIACRGADKFTLDMFTYFYFTELNGIFNDMALDGEAAFGEVLRFSSEVPRGRERVLAFIEVLRDLGQHFGHGFTAIDNEQAQYLFYSGNAAFYYSGSWDATAMFTETDFEVGVMPLPPIGHKHRFSQFFSGEVSECGAWGDAGFGIPQASKNFDLALELLQFMSSFAVNQKFAQRCNYLPIVKGAEFTGHLEGFQPNMKGHALIWAVPFAYMNGRNCYFKRHETLETIIIENRPDAVEYFQDCFRTYRPLLVDELEEEVVQFRRKSFERETKRSRLALAHFRQNVGSKDAQKLQVVEAQEAEMVADSALIELTDLLEYLEEIEKF